MHLSLFFMLIDIYFTDLPKFNDMSNTLYSNLKKMLKMTQTESNKLESKISAADGVTIDLHITSPRKRQSHVSIL